MPVDRREVLMGAAIGFFVPRARAFAAVVRNKMPWRADAADPPVPVRDGPWQFFSPLEAAVVEHVVDRLIPPDPETTGGKGAGCAVYIDRQLAGPFGKADGLYREGPFTPGTLMQGAQSALTPAEQFRQGLTALDKYCRSTRADRGFAELDAAGQDQVLRELESGSAALEGVSAKDFFRLLLQLTQEGFFADPVYGGNRDMCGWKMIGFPGARYDYRDWVLRHNERYPHPPVGIGRPGRTGP